MLEKCLRRKPGIPAIPASRWTAGREAEGGELKPWCSMDTAQLTQPMALMLWDQTGPFLHTDPCRVEEKKNNTPRQTVLSKPLYFPSGRGTTAAPASATASEAQPRAGHSISEAVPQLSQLHRQLIPPCTAEHNSLMPIKQLVLSTCKCEEEAGWCCSFKEMFCGNYTARDTPALPSDNIRKVCRQKPKDKTFLIIILALEQGFIFTSLYASDLCCC